MKSTASSRDGALVNLAWTGGRALLAACLCVGWAYGDDTSTPAHAGGPAVFVIDSANTLRSFDVNGNALQKMQFKSEVGDLNGGMTLAMDKVYVTWVKSAGNEAGGGVFAFDAVTLKQVRLHIGAFNVPAAVGDPGERHGIAYDPQVDRFFVASDHLGLLTFDRSGKFVPRPVQSALSVSAIAYDFGHKSLWGIVAHKLVTFSGENMTLNPGPSGTDAPSRRGFGAAAVALCTEGVDDAPPLTVIAVAYTGLGAGSHLGSGQTYDVAGKHMGASYGAKILEPRGISCTSSGEVFIAAQNGLLEYTLQGAAISPPGELGGLSSPLRGVLAAH